MGLCVKIDTLKFINTQFIKINKGVTLSSKFTNIENNSL